MAAMPHCWQQEAGDFIDNASDFTGRIAVSPRVPSHPHLVPSAARDAHKRPVDCSRRHWASPPVPPSRAAWRRVERRWSEIPAAVRPELHTYVAGDVGLRVAGAIPPYCDWRRPLPGVRVLLEAAHRPQPRLQPSMVALNSVVGILLGFDATVPALAPGAPSGTWPLGR